jgi:D-sedoheptulose 7-phosphate isomerase
MTTAFICFSSGEFDQLAELIREVYLRQGYLYVIGNGGSAATASHMVCDLTNAMSDDHGNRLRAFALADNVPLLTALANDCGYNNVFANQVHSLVDPHDMVIAISVSGTSPNVVSGLRSARAKGARTAGLLGSGGDEILELVDVALRVPSREFGVVEVAHLAIVHALAEALSN